MKTKQLIVLFMLLCGTATAGITNELDSLRQLLLSPRLQAYHQEVERLSTLIVNTSDHNFKRLYAKEIIEASNVLESTIKTLFGYKTESEVTPVYVGTPAQSAIYPVIGGFIFPVTYKTTGSLPEVYREIDQIKDHAWMIVFSFKPEGADKNTARIIRRNSNIRKAI